MENARFVRTAGVLWRQSADVVLVRSISDPEIIELGGTAVLLWLALVQPVSGGELVADLAEVTGASVDVVAADVGTALTQLERRGLVARLPEAS